MIWINFANTTTRRSVTSSINGSARIPTSSIVGVVAAVIGTNGRLSVRVLPPSIPTKNLSKRLRSGHSTLGSVCGFWVTVCYNFSIQYIIGDHFEHSIKAIKVAVKPGGLLIGITPEKSLIEDTKSPDALGNMFEIHGDKVLMSLTDGPFYADGPKYEPLLDGGVLRQALDPEFRCIAWGPITPVKTGLVTDIYAQFVFLRIE